MHKIIDSLYLHFPFCTHLCNYCDFYKKVPVNREEDLKKYHSYLDQSFIVHENLIKKHGYFWGELKTLYIGGGTPSLWGKEGRAFLQNFLQEKKIQLAADCEFTLEVNPGAWTEESLKQWKSFGVNRYSLGVQSLNPQMIKYLDRVHSIDDVYQTLKYFGENQSNFSVDIMLGLPNSVENNRDVISELVEILKYRPSHFSVYILTVKDNYPFYKNLPNEEWIENEFLKVSKFLIENGFHHYEVSNFSKLDKQSNHNLNYWQSKTVAAFGPSATGFLSEERVRYKWKPNSPSIELEVLTQEEFKLEKMYMALRSSVGIKLSDYVTDPIVRSNIIEKWSKLEYLESIEPKVILNSKGFLMLDSLMGDLFSVQN